jgi:hypothetical protein
MGKNRVKRAILEETTMLKTGLFACGHTITTIIRI